MPSKRKNADRDARWLAVYETYSPVARMSFIDNEALKHGMTRDAVLSAIRKEKLRQRKESCK